MIEDIIRSAVLTMLDTIAIAIHIPAGLTALAAGVVAMLSRKGAWWHRRAGIVYLTAILVLFGTAAILVTTRGPQFSHLLILGAVAATLATGGYLMRRREQGLHIAGMGLSYVAMLTAFYVDNGPKLPFWNLFPPVFFWFLPAAIGLPIIIATLWRRGYRCLQ